MSELPTRCAPPSTSAKISLHCVPNVTLATRSFYPSSGWDAEENPHWTVVHPVTSLYTDTAYLLYTKNECEYGSVSKFVSPQVHGLQ